MADALLQSGGTAPVDIELLDGGVVHVGLAADEKHDFFVVGRFQRLAHPYGGGDGGRNFHQVDTPQPRVFRVCQQGIEGGLGRLCDARITLLDATDAAGGEHVLVVGNGVEDEIDLPAFIGRQLNHEALAHWVSLGSVVVCEGLLAARSMLACLFHGGRASLGGMRNE